ncbi:hypothetical protein PTTG_08440 [Puccinia triticina 1-1 BBBD Race 1]|uniref:Glycosyltransferase family 32 protein n=2 Tax=Puccinia triticina TaxID=208348 RepID=A0A180G7P1_PUCT1|nr:uncharacterized protein PtA15_7A542 [Puccinia triticina]OAV88342.1 hypothetical protein PTTG_08440 [Puccinia triticina 1-1 BBBD Race 1]WAQ86813.1 hypothetical protein PtA15_7A542 [Puccinia triticina]WAR56681.1 hypothetical protein PtB15_7B531 [Puccinia triticina]
MSPSKSLLPSATSPPRKTAHRTQHALHRLGQALPAGLQRAIQLVLSRYRLILGLLAAAGLLFHYLVQTHIQIDFYRRAALTQLLPPAPPGLSRRCFAPHFLANPFEIQPGAFPSSPAYNLSLGTLGLQPKVLALSPGFNLPHHDDCYRFAATIPQRPTDAMLRAHTLDGQQTTYYHLYWRSDLSPISDRQIITLKSLLATQDFRTAPNAILPISQLILWTNPSARSLENDPLLAPLLYRYRDRLSLRIIDLASLSKHTPLQEHHLLASIFDKKAWLDGDLIRVLVLWHYGGFWIDMDNLVLRDFRVLGEHEWVVQWDCYDKPYEPLNGHIMHFLKHSPYLCEMMEMMSKPPWPRRASTDWGQHLYHRLYRSLISSGVTPFKVLPYCFTDGRSCTLKDRIPDPFDPIPTPSNVQEWDQALATKLKSLFAIHLHNQWHKQFPKNGWVYRLYINHWNTIID